MSSMGLRITQWKTKPRQFTTHTECTSGSGNLFSWRYLETERGTLHMCSYFLSVAISLHALLQTRYWTKHDLDLIQYGCAIALSSSPSILARSQML